VVDLLDNHPTIKEITAVDADDIIISLAKKYLQSVLKSKTNYICEDASKFIFESRQTYDLVLFDVFIDDETPLPFMQKEFLAALKKGVSKKGILLFSKIEDSNKSRIENTQFESVFTDVFNESFAINTDGNKVFCWINNQL
jgi:spermidine synthase